MELSLSFKVPERRPYLGKVSGPQLTSHFQGSRSRWTTDEVASWVDPSAWPTTWLLLITPRRRLPVAQG
jgi:hypothetical protein